MDTTVETPIKLISGKYKIGILHYISDNTTARFGDLFRHIDGIPRATLAICLKDLIHDGIIQKRIFTEVPLRVEYTLSLKGKNLIPLLHALKEWHLNY